MSGDDGDEMEDEGVEPAVVLIPEELEAKRKKERLQMRLRKLRVKNAREDLAKSRFAKYSDVELLKMARASEGGYSQSIEEEMRLRDEALGPIVLSREWDERKKKFVSRNIVNPDGNYKRHAPKLETSARGRHKSHGGGTIGGTCGHSKKHKLSPYRPFGPLWGQEHANEPGYVEDFDGAREPAVMWVKKGQPKTSAGGPKSVGEGHGRLTHMSIEQLRARQIQLADDVLYALEQFGEGSNEFIDAELRFREVWEELEEAEREERLARSGVVGSPTTGIRMLTTRKLNKKMLADLKELKEKLAEKWKKMDRYQAKTKSHASDMLISFESLVWLARTNRNDAWAIRQLDEEYSDLLEPGKKSFGDYTQAELEQTEKNADRFDSPLAREIGEIASKIRKLEQRILAEKRDLWREHLRHRDDEIETEYAEADA